ncbi:FUSC family protein [Pseudoroseomonas cervicalis]|uniref:FUSC family protein n=1 Tax=Teichococcus cervicalis TaxID=204525 RepID=UPI0027885E69|nr:FUSC family protein [Pseudoroseomonas cervicalis]MDQ1081249.1 putative membrane protein YccC [Pseudoroseomonas cervicalis]
MPRLPILADWLYSARSFAAAALALWIAFSLDLPRPYWAMATVYIVAQPFSGALRAKALWRLAGTLCGGIFSILALPLLIAAPPLFALALALWLGLCLAASFYDPTPRAYAFMLSGYTAALICFPIVDQPGTVFDTAISRMIEIGLGILCAWLMHGVLFPQHGAPRLLAASRAWLADLARLAEDSLTRPHDPDRFAAERRRVARDGAALSALFQQARYEARSRRAPLLWAGRLHEHARALPTLLTAIGERNRALATLDPEAAAALATLQADIAGWMTGSAGAAPDAAQRLKVQRLEARLEEAASHPLASPDPWTALLRDGLLERLRELLAHWRECLVLVDRLQAERPADATPDNATRPPGHVDPLLVALSGGAAALALLIGCALWIGTGWAHGASLAMMSGVALCIFAQLDDPAPALRQFILGAGIAVLLAGLYQFVVLPRIDGFPLLLLVLAVVYLPAGALMAQPALMAPALAVAATVPAVINLQETYSADFAAWADGGLATLGGLALALLTVRLLRSLGVAWRVRRLARADRQDLARLAEGRAPAELRHILGVMLDRFEALAARLQAVDARAVPVSELADLRAALNLLRLREQLPALPAAPRAALEAALAALAAEARGQLPRDTLLARLDAALLAAAGAPGRAARQAALSLGGLRMALFPEATSPFTAGPAPGATESLPA